MDCLSAYERGSMENEHGQVPDLQRKVAWWDRPVGLSAVFALGAIMCFGSFLISYRRSGFSNFAQLMLLLGLYSLFLFWIERKEERKERK